MLVAGVKKLLGWTGVPLDRDTGPGAVCTYMVEPVVSVLSGPVIGPCPGAVDV